MHLSAPDEDHPYLDTSIARLMRPRLEMTHTERGIAVISGPWGIGKTWAINAFSAEHEFDCAVVKVTPGSSRKGTSRAQMLAQVLSVMNPRIDEYNRPNFKNSGWALEVGIYNCMNRYNRDVFEVDDFDQPFTFIFDEAQHLSRDAIELLRFCNDGDRPALPRPVGLVFVGNDEFALQDDGSGSSVISGAVRSRLMFEDRLAYANLSEEDIERFLKSRGITDAGALAELMRILARANAKDLRATEAKITLLKRRAGQAPITADFIRQAFGV